MDVRALDMRVCAAMDWELDRELLPRESGVTSFYDSFGGDGAVELFALLGTAVNSCCGGQLAFRYSTSDGVLRGINRSGSAGQHFMVVFRE